MKYTILLLTIILFSCTRGSDLPNNEPEISFDINGTHYSFTGYQGGTNINGIAANKFTLSGSSSYIFTAYLNNGNMISIEVGTGPDTLMQKSYTIGSVGATINADSDGYLLVGQDPRNVTINGYQNGIVNGTFVFTASKIVSPSGFVPTLISNGIIKNVRINY